MDSIYKVARRKGEKFDILEFLGSGALGGVFKTSLKGPQCLLLDAQLAHQRSIVAGRAMEGAGCEDRPGVRLGHGNPP